MSAGAPLVGRQPRKAPTSLSEVEKASKSTISTLIHSAEGIISDERLAWLSTASQGKGDEQPSKKEESGHSKLDPLEA